MFIYYYSLEFSCFYYFFYSCFVLEKLNLSFLYILRIMINLMCYDVS